MNAIIKVLVSGIFIYASISTIFAQDAANAIDSVEVLKQVVDHIDLIADEKHSRAIDVFARGEQDAGIHAMINGLLNYQGVHGNHYQMMKLNLALMYIKSGNNAKADQLFDEIMGATPDIGITE